MASTSRTNSYTGSFPLTGGIVAPYFAKLTSDCQGSGVFIHQYSSLEPSTGADTVILGKVSRQINNVTKSATFNAAGGVIITWYKVQPIGKCDSGLVREFKF